MSHRRSGCGCRSYNSRVFEVRSGSSAVHLQVYTIPAPHRHKTLDHRLRWRDYVPGPTVELAKPTGSSRHSLLLTKQPAPQKANAKYYMGCLHVYVSDNRCAPNPVYQGNCLRVSRWVPRVAWGAPFGSLCGPSDAPGMATAALPIRLRK